jgi:HAD superfamily hydrolase (TIGR01459 family)
MGCPRDAWDVIVTSGDATRFELRARAPGPVFKIGPEEFDRPLWEGLGLETTTLDQARFVAISGLNREDETPEDYADILAQAKARDLEMICANPDIVVRVGDRLVWCAGAVARDYSAIGGRVIMAGKPYAPIYGLAYRELETHIGRAIDKSRILCIGDGVPTDVAGANGQSLDCLFIASGMHGEALFSNGVLDPTKVEAALAAEGVHATYVMPDLA